MLKGFWKRLPFHIKAVVCFWCALLFFFFLFIMSCAGGTDEMLTNLESDAQKTAEYFEIEWADGTRQDVLAFYNEMYDENSVASQGYAVKEFYLVTKKSVNFQGIKIGIGDLYRELSVQIYALGLPVSDNDEYEVEDGKTFLSSYTCSVNDNFFEIPTAKKILIPQGIKIRITFERTAYLEYVASTFTTVTGK